MPIPVTDLDSLLSQLLADPSGDIWTQTGERMPSLNSAQDELVEKLLGFSTRFQKVFDLFSELQEIEETTITTNGLIMSTVLDDRYFLTNGFVNSEIIVDQKTKYPKRLGVSNLGSTMNFFNRGSDLDPKCYIFKDTYNLLISTGSYPVPIKIFYVGRPYRMVASGAAGIDRDRTVANPDLNPMLHNVMIKIAQMKCYQMRSDQADIARIQKLSTEINEDIVFLATGSKNETQNAPPLDGEARRTQRAA